MLHPSSIVFLGALCCAADTRSSIQGIVYALDISQLMGDKLPTCKEADYEQWTVPADDHTPRCLLGELGVRSHGHCVQHNHAPRLVGMLPLVVHVQALD